MSSFRLPDLGEGLTEADVVRWHVAVGDEVTLNQTIVEVETAKASVELPSPFAGTVVALLAEEGATVAVGSPIIEIGSSVDESLDSDESAGRTPVLVGYGVSGDEPSRRRGRGGPRSTGSTPTTTPGRPLASPPVRVLAHERGIDLNDVVATGAAGQVTRDDLDAHGELNAQRDEIRVPVTGVRKRTAEAMVRSAFTAPHVTEFFTVDATETVLLVDKLRASDDWSGIKVTPLTVVAKALLTALIDYPELNSRWDDATGDIVTPKAVQLGIAADTPRGLLVPHIRDAHTLGMRDLARRLEELTATARDGATPPADLVGGTITITNIGVFGIDSGTPILNPGEAGILCVGAIRRIPWEHHGDVALRSVMTLSLSFDHRVVDGALGSKFLAAVGRMIQDPVVMLAR